MRRTSFDLMNRLLHAYNLSAADLFVKLERSARHRAGGKLCFHSHSARSPVLSPESRTVQQETDGSSEFPGILRGDCQSGIASDRHKRHLRIEERINNRSPTRHGLELNDTKR